MKAQVRQFTVSKNLLLGADGKPDKETINTCYEIRKVLNAGYRQWRIEVRPFSMCVKLQNNKGEIVVNAMYQEQDILDDWLTVLIHAVEVWSWLDTASILADA